MCAPQTIISAYIFPILMRTYSYVKARASPRAITTIAFRIELCRWIKENKKAEPIMEILGLPVAWRNTPCINY